MVPPSSIPARLHDQQGVLRPLFDDAPLGERSGDPVAWLWEGRLDPTSFASLLATALRGGRTSCFVDARPYWVTPRVCWYDAENGRAVLQLLGPPEPVVDA